MTSYSGDPDDYDEEDDIEEEYDDLDDVNVHGGFGAGSYFQHAMDKDD